MARQRAEEQRNQEAYEQSWHQNDGDDEEEEYEDGRRSYSPPPPQFADSHMAVAWHFDTSEVWATAGHRTGDEAEETALTACNTAMGGGCMIGSHWYNNSFIAVAHDAFGVPWIKGGARLSSIAEAAALDNCRKSSIGCKLTRVFAETPLPQGAPSGIKLSDDYFPAAPIARHSFAIVAWPEKAPAEPWRGIVWLSTGERSWQQASDRLLAKCQADSGTACTLGTTVPNGVMVRYVDDKGVKFWVGAPSAARAQDRINTLCAKGSRCWVIDTLDAITPRFTVIHEDRISPSGRGFFALAWTTAKWPRMAIVTGRKSNAEAVSAAMALCAAQSKLRCTPYLDDGDAGNGRYLAIYRDSAENVRTYIGFTPDELEYRAKVACDKAKVSCTQRAMIDLGKVATLTPAV